MTSLVQSDNSTERVLGLLYLPHELLIIIFKNQSSFQDVSRLSQACRLLYKISHSNAHAIANAIDQQPAIRVHEAVHLADVQFKTDVYESDDELLIHAHNISSAVRDIANSISPHLVSYYCNEALRLTQVQLVLASSNAVQKNPTFSLQAKSCLLESPVATAGFDAHITGGVDYFGLRQRIVADTQDSVCALVMAAARFIPLTRRVDSKCTVHPSDALLPHEIARFFGAWYWFKLYVSSCHSQSDGLRQTLATELKTMNAVQLTVYLCILNFLFSDLEVEQASTLGIKDLDENAEYESSVLVEWWRARKEWNDLRHDVIVRHDELEIPAQLEEWVNEGWFEACRGEGNCKPRGKEKGIWEL